MRIGVGEIIEGLMWVVLVLLLLLLLLLLVVVVFGMQMM
jgi:hypothetical protein